ncbi:MAG: glutamine synthetase family protein [Rhodobacteraceae bacterium]|nr:glutamine synthetase family protein [Paracoccaceae bacterium]
MSKMISDANLARMGLLSAEACEAGEALLTRVAASDLETVRVLFTDQHGVLRGKTLVASAFPSAFTSGIAVASTLLLKDTSHRTVFPVWDDQPGPLSGPMQGVGDIRLVPDPATFRILPWSPHSAWIFCDVVHRDGTPIPYAARTVLKNATARLARADMAATIGLEVEFHIFERTDAALEHPQTTMPGAPPQTRALTHGYQYLTETRYSDAEAILDELRRAAQALDLPVRSVEIEMGPSQFEFTFEPASPMQHADNLMMFRTMVKEVCAGRGLHASFMAKPRLANITACGWHIHMSLADLASGRALFIPDRQGELTPQADGWIAGLLAHATETSLLIAPTVNSYKRYQPFQLAPNRIQWGHDNRGAMIRALMAPGDMASRIENRAPDTSANPYYALAAQLIAGLEGITHGLKSPAPTRTPYQGDAGLLPTNLAQAIDAFEGSAMLRRTMGDEMVDYLTTIKRFEWDRYLSAISEWEQAEYFSLF